MIPRFPTIAIAIVLLLGACGIREVTMRDGTAITEYFIGLSETVTCDAKDAVSMEQTSLGFWAKRREFGIGAQIERYACANPECQIVMWVENDAQAASLKKLLGDPENLCIL